MFLRELFESRVLLEYDRSKTAVTFGNKLIQAFIADRGHQDEYVLMTKTKLSQGMQLTPEKQDHIVDYLLSSLEQADPTINKEYVQWLAKVYSNEGIKLEDIKSKGADWLAVYHKLKKYKLLPTELKDIGRLSFSILGDIAINPEYTSKLDASVDKPVINKGTANEVYNDAEIRVIHPEDKEAACYYGQGTQWCTAASNNNMFSEYADDGELYILIPKKPKYAGEKYQLHFESSSFMNERDIPIDMVDLFKRFPQLRQVFDNNKFIFDADDWYSTEEMQNFRKYLPAYETALLERSRKLSAYPIDQLLYIEEVRGSEVDRNRKIFDDVPGLEDEITRLFKEGWFFKGIVEALFNIVLVTNPEQLNSFIQHIARQEKEFYNYERYEDDRFQSYLTDIKNSCSKLLWDYLMKMIKLNMVTKPIKDALTVTILRNGISVWQDVIKEERG